MKNKSIFIALLFIATIFTSKAAIMDAPIIGPLTFTEIDINSVSLTFTTNTNGGTVTNTWIQHNTVNGWLSPIATTKLTRDASYQVTTINGLSPNTTYYFRAYSTNAQGQQTISDVVSATTKTAAPVSQTIIAEFKFNGLRTSENGNLIFSAINTTFNTNRDLSNNSGAIAMNNQSTSANIPNLPIGNSARTVSIWVKLNSFNSDNFNQFFSYGSGAIGKWFAGGMNGTNVILIGYSENKYFTTTNTTTWNHFVFVYDGTSSTVYKNGVSLGTQVQTLNTSATSTFNLGLGVGGEKAFNGSIDDLKIFNYALNQTDITSLYTNNVITAIDNNLETKTLNMYPNPARDIVHVSGFSEILTLSGNKVAEGTETINISGLASGIYIVKTGNKTSKLIKE